MKNAIALLAGVIFAMGLGISGMTRPSIVRGFLDVFGAWNPTLIGVMFGAIGVHGVTYFFIKKRSAPLLDKQFFLPEKSTVDGRLMIGAMLFGLGWGWAGICPGPGIVALVSGDPRIFLFIFSMLAGMKVFQFLEDKN